MPPLSRPVDDRPFLSPTRRVKFLSLAWNVCKVFGDTRTMGGAYRCRAAGRRRGAGLFRGIPRCSATMERYVATGSQTTSCLMSQYNDGPRNSTKSKWMLPGGSPTREMIPVNERNHHLEYHGTTKAMRRVSRFADSFFGNFHLFTVGNFEL